MRRLWARIVGFARSLRPGSRLDEARIAELNGQIDDIMERIFQNLRR